MEYWVGWPLTRKPVAHRPTLYLRERCKQAKVFQEIHDLILVDEPEGTKSLREFSAAVDRVATKLQYSRQHLPFELQYVWPMSIAVWELQ